MSDRPRSHYGTIAIVFHWTVALLIVGQFMLGLAMTSVDSMTLQFWLIQWHKSFGLLTLALATARLAWRAVDLCPGPATGLSGVERAAASTVQTALLLLTLAVPLAGWALASTSTLAIPTFAFNLVVVPHLPLAPSPSAEAFWRQAHGLLAYAMILLAAGHAGAALRHHFLLRDAVLARMLPVRRAESVRSESNENV